MEPLQAEARPPANALRAQAPAALVRSTMAPTVATYDLFSA